MQLHAGNRTERSLMNDRLCGGIDERWIGLLSANRGGRPPFIPTDDQKKIVSMMTALGLPQDRIQMVIINPRSGKPIERVTLARAFSDEIELARAQLDLVFAMTEGIRRGDIRAIGLYARNRMGWRDGKRRKVEPAIEQRPDNSLEIVFTHQPE